MASQFSRCKRTSKRGYRSKLSALTVASRAARSADQRAYRCPFCRNWHLTSQPLKPRKPSSQADSSNTRGRG